MNALALWQDERVMCLFLSMTPIGAPGARHFFFRAGSPDDVRIRNLISTLESGVDADRPLGALVAPLLPLLPEGSYRLIHRELSSGFVLPGATASSEAAFEWIPNPKEDHVLTLDGSANAGRRAQIKRSLERNPRPTALALSRAERAGILFALHDRPYLFEAYREAGRAPSILEIMHLDPATPGYIPDVISSAPHLADPIRRVWGQFYA